MMLSRDEYVQILKDLFSKDQERIREANRKLYAAAVGSGDGGVREQDLALAEAAVNS